MGLAGFLQFVVKCSVDVLAWPLLALAYPLCASIRAIETNSVLDTQKLNTYWVVFSLILLLEQVFCLFDWFPFWPYLRLIIICLLVIPYFDGAFYVYKQITSSLLSIDAQIIIYWLTKPKEASVDTEKILADVTRYVRENGTEALEKIIADKSGSTKNLDAKAIKAVSSKDKEVVNQENSNGSHVARKSIKAEEAIEKTEVKAAMQVSRVEPEDTRIKNITALPTEAREKVSEVQAGRVLPKTPVSKVSNIEPEVTWTDYVTAVPTGIRGVLSEVQFGSVLPQTHVPNKVQYNRTCGICEVTLNNETDYFSHFRGKKHKSTMDEAEKSKKLWCKVCNIKCPSKAHMKAHLKGKKHMNLVATK